MKKIIPIIIVSLYCALSCNNTPPKAGREQIDPVFINKAILRIESFLDSLENVYPMSMSTESELATRDSAQVIWKDFKKLCAEKNFKEAYGLYNIHSADFKVHMRHSTPRYIFLNYIYKSFLIALEHPDSIGVKYLNEIEMEYYMQRASIDLSSKDQPYVPEVHHWTIVDYGRALNQLGRRTEAIDLIPELKEATLFLTNDAMEANYGTAAYSSYLLADSGETELAIDLLRSFRTNIITWREEDAGEDWAEDYYNYYLDQVDDLIESLR